MKRIAIADIKLGDHLCYSGDPATTMRVSKVRSKRAKYRLRFTSPLGNHIDIGGNLVDMLETMGWAKDGQVWVSA